MLARRQRSEGRKTASRGVVFAVVSVALFMSSIDGTIVATALPALHLSLRASINWASWTVTAYQLGQTIAMPVAGRISDQFGRKTVFIVSAVVFTLASLLCGLANSIFVLLAIRVVQALGGGAFMPCATGIVADHFGEDRDKAIGLFSSIFPLGALVGPVLGGIIISYWSWREIFFINVPIGVVLIVLSIRLLPTSERRQADADLIGAGLLGATILGAMIGITSLGDGGSSVVSPNVVLPVVLGVVAGIAFVHRSRHIDHPIIPPALLWGRKFLVMNAINLAYGAGAMGFGALVPLYAEDRFRMPALQAGTLLTARAVGMIMVAALASLMLRRTGYRLPMIVGFGLVAIGLVVLASSPAISSAYAWLSFGACITGLGIGISGPASNNAILDLSPADVGAVAGLRGMFRQAGAIVGISVTTAAIARSPNQGVALGHSFMFFTVIVVAMLPLVFLVPDRTRIRPARDAAHVAAMPVEPAAPRHAPVEAAAPMAGAGPVEAAEPVAGAAPFEAAARHHAGAQAQPSHG